jgi:hypothetical protein
MSSTFKSKGDITSFEKSVDSVTNMFNQLNIEIGKISDKDLRNSLRLDTTEIVNAKQKVAELQ